MSTSTHDIRKSDEVNTSLARDVTGHIMSIIGDVDAFTEATFRSFLTEAVEHRGLTSLDLSRVAFFGVAGVDPLCDFARGFDGSISTSNAIDRVMAIYGIELS